MSFLEIIQAIREITAALKAREWVRLATAITDLITKMLAARQTVGAAKASPSDQAELTAALDEMNAAAAAA